MNYKIIISKAERFSCLLHFFKNKQMKVFNYPNVDFGPGNGS